MEFIQGSKFISLCDDFYSNDDDCYIIKKESINENCKVIYTHNHYIHNLLNYIKTCKKSYIIVSHNTDTNLDYIEIPDNVINIFAQNVNYEHYKLKSIPIGLENDRWFPNINKKLKIETKLNEQKKYKNLLYLNHNIHTNLKERQNLYYLLSNNEWVTSFLGHNGCDFDSYINNIYEHKFVVCPDGHGIDTHRMWETLYLKCIPIVKKSVNTRFYSDLPICFVDSWEEITETFLENEFERIININWNLEKLDFNYWVKQIKI